MSFLHEMQENWNAVLEKDEKARVNGVLIGRYIAEPYADGNAVYEIIKENKKTVRIRVITGIGDDWQVSFWGTETLINKTYVEQKLHQRETMRQLFANKMKRL